MKPFAKWHWGYLPVILLLAVIWYEFWKSSDINSGLGPTIIASTQPDNPENTGTGQVAIAIDPTPIPIPTPPITTPPIATGPGNNTGVAAVNTTPPASLALPPISLRVSNASLYEVIAALNSALGAANGPCLSSMNSGSGTFTLDVKDRPFWEVFRALTAQSPLSFYPNTSAGNTRGLTLSQLSTAVSRGGTAMPSLTERSAIRNFEISGPAMLCATAITFQSSASASPGAAASTGSYRLGLLAAVDPRISVLVFDRIKILDALDDTGHALNFSPIQQTSSASNSAANYSFQILTWTQTDPAAKTMALKCELHFNVQLPGGESAATIEDAESKIGSLVTVGERRIRLARFTTNGSTLQVQFAPDVPSPNNPPVSFTVTDSSGRTILNAVNRPLESFTSGSISGATGPFRIALRSMDRTQDFDIPFELRNIPLP